MPIRCPCCHAEISHDAIQSDQAHKLATVMLERLIALDPAPDTEDERDLCVLIELITNYEQRRWPIGKYKEEPKG